MAERAFWLQTNRHGQVDRLELHDAQYTDPTPELQFKGDKTGFTRQWDEITSESNERLINVQANRIQIGKYDFRPRIENATGFQILEDIRDSDNKRFHIVHKIDGTFEWAGWVTTRIFSYPEKDNNFFAHIRATDFEILQAGNDYLLDDDRQPYITTLVDLFSDLPEDVPIKTATSWTEQHLDDDSNVTKPYDFLAEIYHDTKALREFANTGDETDQPIPKFEALEWLAECGLLIRQLGGHIMIDQLTELADPTDVHETIYNADGTVDTATRSIDRTQTGYASTEDGLPSVKATSQNDTYPAVDRARTTFAHRSKVSGLQLPSAVYLSNNEDQSFSNTFIATGNEEISLSANVFVRHSTDEDGAYAEIQLRVGQYYFNGTNWIEDDSSVVVRVELTGGGQQAEVEGPTGDYYQYPGFVSITTPTLPPDATSPVEVVFRNGLVEAGPDEVADRTIYENISYNVTDPGNSEENSTSINYQLSQTGVNYPVDIDLGDTHFGDWARGTAAALRYSIANTDLTSNTWRRRGQTIPYRLFHANLLKEVLDMGRSNMRKLEAQIWGAYDPTKVLDYNGSYFFFAGGKYDGTRGRWQVTLMELNLQTDDSDDFQDVPKFSDSGGGTGGTAGGGSSTTTNDNRYFKQNSLFSEIATADQNTAIGNLGITATKDELNILDGFTGSTANLNNIDGLTVDLGGLSATSSELNRLDGDLATVQGNLGLKDGSADLSFLTLSVTDAFSANSVRPDTGRFLSPVDYKFRNAGDSDFRSVEMAGLTATTGTFSDDVTVNSDLHINGNIFQEGDTYETHVEQLYTEKDFIISRDGAAGGLPAGDISGLQVNIADGANDVVFGVDDSAIARVGWMGDTLQAVATRPDSPDNNGIGIWDDSNSWYGTSSDLTFDGSVFRALGVTLEEQRFTINALNDTGSGSSLARWRIDTPSHDMWARFGKLTSSSDVFSFQSDAEQVSLWDFNDADVNIDQELEVGDTLTGVDADFSSTLGVGGMATFEDDLQGEGFSSGFTGSNWQMTPEGDLTAGNILLRESLRARELIYDQLGAVGGSQLISYARGKIESIDTGNNEITLEDPNNRDATTFVEDDIFWVMAWDIDGASIVSATGTVTNESGTTLTLSFDSGSISDLSAGDVIVQRGNTSDSDRQSLIYQTASDSDAPFTAYYQNVDAVGGFSPSSVFAQLGVLDNLNSEYSVSGDGIFASRGRFTDDILVGSMDKSGSYFEVDGANLNLVGEDVFIDVEQFDLSAGSDYWRTSDGSFQFGGADGITYPVDSNVKIGSDVDIFGNLDVSSLPRVSDEGLTLLARYDNSGIDSTNNNNVSGTGSSFTTDGEGIWADFNGTGDYYSYDNAYAGASGIFSIWIRPDKLASGQFIISQESSNTNNERAISISANDEIRFHSRDGSGSFVGLTYDSSNWSDGEKIHVVGVQDNTVLELWINGELHDSTDMGTQAGGWTNPTEVGRRVGSEDLHYAGQAQNLRVYRLNFLDVSKEQLIKSLYLYPSGNAGGLISTESLVADQGFFDEIFAQDADITGTLSGQSYTLSDEIEIDTGENGGGFTDANFFASSEDRQLSLGSVFSADGSNDEGQLSSLEVYPTHIQNAADSFRLGNSGLQMSTGSNNEASQALKWYDGGFSGGNMQHALVPNNTGLEVWKRSDSTGNIRSVAAFQDDYLNLPDGLRLQQGMLIALNIPTSDPQRQGQVWHDESNNVLRLSTPGDPVIDATATGSDTIVVEITSATAPPYDIKNASNDNVVATSSDNAEEITGLNPDMQYCFYVTDDNNNDSNTACATTDALEPEISCSGGTNSIQVNLDTPSTSPYTLYRNGSEYDTGLSDGDFPYTDNFITGTYEYQLEDSNGQFSNTTECTAS